MKKQDNKQSRITDALHSIFHVSWSKGFSLVELMVVLGMMSILLSIGGLSLANIRSDSQLDLIASQVKSELLRVQARTANNIPSGVYFEADRFVYFEGPDYVEGAITNEVTNMSSSISISNITFVDSIARFNKLTGYPESYADPSGVVIQETGSGKTRTIGVNEWGVVDIR